MSGDERRILHERRAAALADRISEQTREYTAEELERLVRQARGSGSMPAVEAAAMDNGLVIEWWSQEER